MITYCKDLIYTKEDLDDFLNNIYFEEITNNDGGMKINDMFSFYFLLKKLQPEYIIESGVWNGFSTKLIRKTLGNDCKIICLDPRNISPNGYKDNNCNTRYFLNNNFIDFKDFNLIGFNLDKTLCFFDDHQNAAQRLIHCIEKGVKHIFFNDNYPLNAGSHYTIQHLIDNDTRQKFDLNNQYYYSINTFPQIDLSQRNFLLKKIDKYIAFPNIFQSTIELWEGIFNTVGFFEETHENINKYQLFYKNKNQYSWNVYITLI